MTLYAVAAGATIQAADLNQYFNLLTGVSTDQSVVLLGPTVNVGGDGVNTVNPITRFNAFVGTAAAGIAGGRISFASNGPTGTDGAFLEYAPPASGSNTANRLHVTSTISGGNLDELDLAALVVYCGQDLNVQRNIFSATGQIQAFTGVYAGNGVYRCIEAGNNSNNHIEFYPAQGSNAGTADGTGPTATLTFTRGFAGLPAVSGSCQIAAMSGRGGYAVATAISTTAVTMRFINNDGGSRTVENWSIIAGGV